VRRRLLLVIIESRDACLMLLHLSFSLSRSSPPLVYGQEGVAAYHLCRCVWHASERTHASVACIGGCVVVWWWAFGVLLLLFLLSFFWSWCV